MMDNLQPGIQVEVVRCNLCGADDFRVMYEYDHSSVLTPETAGLEISALDIFPVIVKCRQCDLVYVNPRWTYARGVMPYSQEAEQAYFEQTRLTRIVAYDHLVQLAQRSYPRQSIQALDVGCGDGLLLERCQLAGIDCDGFEVSLPLLHTLQEKFGPQKILSGDLSCITADSYDCVFLINVIEHLPDPRLTLGQIYKLLKPGGCVFVHAPNLGGLPARLSGRRWRQIEPLSHLYYFTNATLRELMQKAGFVYGGNFYMQSSSPVKAVLQQIFNKLGWHADNGLGLIAMRPK
jgi:2-polyprenyl-3-methyl-5-hydroxy-6-metoxy-1,4-benzoquinol methylase